MLIAHANICSIDEWVNTVAADDITFEDMAVGYTASGKEETKAYVQSWKTTFPDMVGQCNNRIESGNTMVEECSWTGTNTGELSAPDGSKIPPTGKTVNIKNCFIYEFENGKIKSMTNYLDMMGMMGQLGLAG